MWCLPHFDNFGWIFFIPLIYLLVWGLGIILLIVIVAKLLKNDRKRLQQKHEETPLYILKKRYAKGEISRDEYEIMKKELKD